MMMFPCVSDSAKFYHSVLRSSAFAEDMVLAVIDEDEIGLVRRMQQI
jgi:hypothetical protein